MSELVHKRVIEDVTRDIRVKTGQFLLDAIEIGRLLFEAKSMVEPGSWGKYVEEELPFSHSWANNYMRLYKELGGEQLSLFGNSQAIMNLQPTKALELLVLPAEEREEFVETHDVESMSSRELHQAIKDLEEEKKARAEEEERNRKLQEDLTKAVDDAQKAKGKLETMAEQATKDVGEANAKYLSAKAEAEKAAREVEDLKKKLYIAETNVEHFKKELRTAKENPDVPEDLMARMRQEAEQAAAEKSAAEIREQLSKAQEAKEKAEVWARELEGKLDAAHKEIRTANPYMVQFKAIVSLMEDTFNRLEGLILKAKETDPDLAEALKKGRLNVLDQMRRAAE